MKHLKLKTLLNEAFYVDTNIVEDILDTAEKYAKPGAELHKLKKNKFKHLDDLIEEIWNHQFIQSNKWEKFVTDLQKNVLANWKPVK